jgi:hypothetical protein
MPLQSKAQWCRRIQNWPKKLQDGMLLATRSIATKKIQQDDPSKKQEVR